VNEFAFTRIRPIVTIEDPMIVATAAPEFYKAQTIGAYKMFLEGKQPPEPDASASNKGLNRTPGARRSRLALVNSAPARHRRDGGVPF
jgi:hypothetical protein